MLSTPEFQKWANSGEAVLFLSIMTKIDDRKDDGLLRTYGHRRFPSLSVLDAEGNLLMKRVGRDTWAMQHAVLAAPMVAKREAGEELSIKDALLTDLRIGAVEAETLEERMAEASEVQWTDAEKAEVATHKLLMTSQELLRNRDNRPGNPGHARMQEHFYGLYKDGTRIPATSSMAGPVEDAVLTVAMAKEDKKIFAVVKDRVLANLKMEVEGRKDTLTRYTGMLESMEEDNPRRTQLEAFIKRFEKGIEDTKARIESIKDFA